MEDLDIFDLTDDEIDSEEEIFESKYFGDLVNGHLDVYIEGEDFPDWNDSIDPYDIEYDI